MSSRVFAAPRDLLLFGWREWVGFPDLGIRLIKAKIDTGARTSALHAFDIYSYSENGRNRVEFKTHPFQNDTETVVKCRADILDTRTVTSSDGYKEPRIVIETMLSVATYNWPVELTLAARDEMSYRLLLGRSALAGRVQVDPSRSYSVGESTHRNRS